MLCEQVRARPVLSNSPSGGESSVTTCRRVDKGMEVGKELATGGRAFHALEIVALLRMNLFAENKRALAQAQAQAFACPCNRDD